MRHWREKKGLTQEQAAELAGMHTRHWQKVEAEEVVGSLRIIAKIASALEVKPLELLK